MMTNRILETRAVASFASRNSQPRHQFRESLPRQTQLRRGPPAPAATADEGRSNELFLERAPRLIEPPGVG
jgi:hypothetical protein